MMKNILQSTWMRVLSTIFCAVLIVNLGIGIFGAVFLAEYHNVETFKDKSEVIIAQNYGLYAIDMLEQGNIEQLKKEFEEKQINCSIEFVSYNLNEKDEVILDPDEIFYVGKFGDEKAVELEVLSEHGSWYRTNSVFAVLAGGYIHFPDINEWGTYPVEGYVYSVDRGIFYYQTSIGYFPVKDVYIYTDVEDLFCDYELVQEDGESYYYNSFNGEKLNVSKSSEWTRIYIDGYGLTPFIPREGLTSNNSVEYYTGDSIVYFTNSIPEDEIWKNEYQVSNREIYCHAPEDAGFYQVKISCVEEAGDSLYVQLNELCRILKAFEDSAVWMIVSSAIAIVVLLVIIVCSAKSRKEQMNFIEKLPVFLYTGAVFLLFFIAIAVIINIGAWMITMDVGSIQWVLVLGIPAAVLTVWLVVGWFQNIVTRIKCKSFWKTSEFYYAYVLLKRIGPSVAAPFKGIVKKCRNLFYKFEENVPLFLGGMLIFGVVSFIELLLVKPYRYGYFWMFMMLKALEAVAFIIALYQIHKLHEGIKRVVSGDTTRPIDTSKMIWKFREHGENINKVSDGIAVAVEDRMKSERFKTELITNVSHDIKTPLTSIINYVDLIKKEELQDEKVREYVDVLDRQSARLKKLIEDLMEASKASTGNLTVSLEECDVAVLLTQVVGEFEEKLEKSQLEVIVDKPEHPVKMLADGRHIWRVFDNLLNNICKYSLQGTRVYVSLKQENEEAVITFKNISKTALNIASEELLERFVRGDSSRNTEGSGLGLSIAQSLTELMQGRMLLEIDGDLFKVTLYFPMM